MQLSCVRARLGSIVTVACLFIVFSANPLRSCKIWVAGLHSMTREPIDKKMLLSLMSVTGVNFSWVLFIWLLS